MNTFSWRFGRIGVWLAIVLLIATGVMTATASPQRQVSSRRGEAYGSGQVAAAIAPTGTILQTKPSDKSTKGEGAQVVAPVPEGSQPLQLLPASAAIRDFSGFRTNVLGRNDDGSTGLVDIGFTLNLFGSEHSQLYVNNNGNVTFDDAQWTYTPYDLTSTSRQIIAPFFADVDTRGLDSGLVTYGQDIVNGRPAFGVNWFNVGYYGARTDKLNTFQLVLIDRSDVEPGDFDIEFNYGQIQWETGDASGGSYGLGGYSARVGFSNGTGIQGTFFELFGSALNGAFLDSNTVDGLIHRKLNSSVIGRYVFETRNGDVAACPENLAQHPLVLIPGWGSADTLIADSSGFAKLIQPLQAAGYHEGCNLFYAGATSAALSLKANGAEVQRVLCNAYPSVSAVLPDWDGAFDLIGHSYGGLRGREYLETELYRGGHDNCPGKSYSVTVRNLLTLGTPHTGGGTLPGAIVIAFPNWWDEDTRDSANALWPWNMQQYNSSHVQPAGVCYRLVGGDVADSERELPFAVRAIYRLLQQTGEYSHHDLGVYVWSSMGLGNSYWASRYPRVVTYETVDIHGYFDKMGLATYRSYVSPSPWETFNLIKPLIGASSSNCTRGGGGGGGGGGANSPLSYEAGQSEAVTLEVLADGLVADGTPVEGVFELSDGGESAVLLEWPVGTLRLELTDPDGNVYDESVGASDPAVQYVAATTIGEFAGFRFVDMAMGTWSYRITWIDEATGQPIPYVLYRLPERPISVAAWASPAIQANGESVQLTAEVRYAGIQAVSGAQVVASVTLPSGRVEVMSLVDDGNHSDGAADDGTYGGSFTTTSEGGQYHVSIEATGSYQSQAFRRRGMATFVVMSAANVVDGVLDEWSYDVDADGDNDSLLLDLEITVGEADEYRLSADLVTDDGYLVAQAATEDSLQEGQQSVTLVFDGADIATSLRNGPYSLANVLLLKAANNAVQDAWEGSYVTSAYDYWEFQLPPALTGFEPMAGPVGSVVTLTGYGFTQVMQVLFGDQAATTITEVSDAQIDVVVPATAVSSPITVITDDGEVVSDESFQVLPSITGFAPSSGAVGTVVTISGTTLQEVLAVAFNNVPAPEFRVMSNSMLEVAVPVGATTGPIIVTSSAGSATSTTNFTVTAPPTSAIYLSPTGTGTIAGKAFTGADILSYVKPTSTWDVFYDGSYVRTVKNVGAFAFQSNDILLGFSAAQVVPGLGATAAAPQDLVRFTPTRTGYNNTAGTFAWFFDGSDVGLTTSGEIIDAVWIDANGRLYISTTGAGAVPQDSANPTGPTVRFQDEDVLRFTPRTTGATTSGTWSLYWDPTLLTGMSVEDINGYWEDPTTGHRYVTILGAFTIGNTAYGAKLTGNGKTILRFASNAAAPGGWAPAEKVVWLAPGATFPSNVDGIEMAR